MEISIMSTTPAKRALTVPEALDQIVAAGEVPSLRRASGTYEIDIEVDPLEATMRGITADAGSMGRAAKAAGVR